MVVSGFGVAFGVLLMLFVDLVLWDLICFFCCLIFGVSVIVVVCRQALFPLVLQVSFCCVSLFYFVVFYSIMDTCALGFFVEVLRLNWLVLFIYLFAFKKMASISNEKYRYTRNNGIPITWKKNDMNITWKNYEL